MITLLELLFSMTAPETLEMGRLVTELGGGRALFLYGMRRMTEALKTVAGSRMKNLMARLTANRFTAALAGAIVTAVIQSSSVTTVLVVGFISAGILNLSQSIGVIIGANIGTTVTAQIIAFQIYKYGLVMIAVGFFTEVIARRETVKQRGAALMGLGLIFFGMQLMSIATGPLRQWQPFIDLMQHMQSPFLAVLIGMVFTAIVQSSSATTGVVIVLASQGLMSLETGIGLVLGANVGTCVTAVIAAVGRPREATQAAWIHVLFNAGGVLLWMFFIPQLAEVVRAISPSASHFDGLERLATDTPRQIANAHTLFNVGNALLFIWFTKPLANLVDRIVPKPPRPKKLEALYLDDLFLEQPAMAFDQTHRELVRLAEIDREILAKTLQVVSTGSREDISALARVDDDIDTLHGAIVIYLGNLSQKHLADPQPQQLYRFIAIANYLENIGDVINKNLLENAIKRLRLGVGISPSTMSVLEPLHEKVLGSFDCALNALRFGDHDAAVEAIESKAVVNQLGDDATAHLAKRLVASEPNRLAAYQIETDVIENLKRINTLTRRIARTVLEFTADETVASEQTTVKNDGSES